MEKNASGTNAVEKLCAIFRVLSKPDQFSTIKTSNRQINIHIRIILVTIICKYLYLFYGVCHFLAKADPYHSDQKGNEIK